MVCWVPSAVNNIPTAWQMSYFFTSMASALASFHPWTLASSLTWCPVKPSPSQPPAKQ